MGTPTSTAKAEKGQSLIVVAFSIFTLIGFVGLAVDLGLTYVERIRIRRATDAAALAAATELPLEETAHIRALEFLDENDYGCQLEVDPAASGYRCADTTTVRLEIDGSYVSGPNVDQAERVIRIDTAEFRDPPTLQNSASRIRVSVTEEAPIYFMAVLGFDDMPVEGSAVAENINHLDVVLVFDRSGSMEFDTLCYGCWEPDSGESYPDGNFYPLPWDSDDDGSPDHCEGNDPIIEEQGGTDNYYYIIEAEEYSRLSNSYNRDMTTLGYTYWVLQRNGDSDSWWLGDTGAYGRDSRGAYLGYHPARTHDGADGTGVPCYWDDLTDPEPGWSFPAERACSRHSDILALGGPFPSPRADYEFTVEESDTYYVWMRGQGGNGGNVFWGLSGPGYSDYELIGREYFNSRGSGYTNGGDGTWMWDLMGCSENSSDCGNYLQADETYTLHLWGGDPGFDADRIIITNDNDCDDDDDAPPWSVRNSGHIDNNRTAWACDPCDARFGGAPSVPAGSGRPICTSGMAPQPNRLEDYIYDDEQPIRGSVEAAKNFVRRMDPRYDQIGYVSYSSSASIDSQLECVRRRGLDDCTADNDNDGVSDRIESEVIQELEDTHAGGGTNIADGIDEGIKVLSNTPGQYGRPGAAHIMVVMTDGESNTVSGTSSACDDEDLWPDNSGGSNVRRAKDCVVYYAMQARNNGIVIYSITLGDGADIELMQYIAELTGGVHRHAPRPEQLDAIFEELYKRIFLRLVE